MTSVDLEPSAVCMTAKHVPKIQGTCIRMPCFGFIVLLTYAEYPGTIVGGRSLEEVARGSCRRGCSANPKSCTFGSFGDKERLGFRPQSRELQSNQVWV